MCINEIIFLIWLYFLVLFEVCYELFTLTGSDHGLAAVEDFGAQNCQYTTKVDACHRVRRYFR
jgi:hypothetical protein